MLPPCPKTAYPDKKSALTALNSICRRPKTRIVPARAYACPTCHAWHLTSQWRRF